MKIDLLKHTIVNAAKSITYKMKKPAKKFFRKSYESILEFKTPVISHLWDTNNKDSAKTLRKYFSRNLWLKEWCDLPKKVEKVMIKFIWNINKKSDFFCFDTVDINKNTAKKMEWLKVVRDWSTWTFGNGYVFHWVSIKSIPLFLHKEADKLGVKMENFKYQLKEIKSIFWAGYWILADRWYDDFKKFKLLIKLNFKFIIRLKTTRNVEILNWDLVWKTIKIWHLKEWRYKVKIKEIDIPLYIFVRTLKWMKTPIRIISNIKSKKAIKRYLKRWEKHVSSHSNQTT